MIKNKFDVPASMVHLSCMSATANPARPSRLVEIRLRGISDCLFPASLVKRSGKCLVFAGMPEGRKVTMRKTSKGWNWTETSKAGTFKGSLSAAGIANLSRLLSRIDRNA
jgi:hypothetical protein